MAQAARSTVQTENRTWWLGTRTAPASAEPSLEGAYKDARRIVLDAFEKRYLTRLLQRTGGNVSLAAREARMDRSYLIDLLHRHDIK